MPQRIWREVSDHGLGQSIIGGNSVQFTTGDEILINAAGFLAMTTAGGVVLGVAGGNVTMAADNQTVAAVRPSYRPWHGLHMLYGADQACTQTDVGAYADFGTVTTGAFQLNLAAGTSGQCHVLAFNPNAAETSATDVVVEFSEVQSLAYAQA